MSKATTRPARQLLAAPLTPFPLRGGQSWRGPKSLTTPSPSSSSSSPPPNRKSLPAPTSDLPHPTSLPPISSADRDKLDLFSHVDADLINLAKNLHIQPTQALEWSIQPHIEPWLALLTKARHDHRKATLSKSLQTALDNLRRIIDSHAADKIKVTAVNSMTKLANALLRSSSLPRGGGPGRGWQETPNSRSPQKSQDLNILLSTANADLLSVEHSHDLRSARNHPDKDTPFFYERMKLGAAHPPGPPPAASEDNTACESPPALNQPSTDRAAIIPSTERPTGLPALLPPPQLQATQWIPQHSSARRCNGPVDLKLVGEATAVESMKGSPDAGPN